jgi:hypothetical protein
LQHRPHVLKAIEVFKRFGWGCKPRPASEKHELRLINYLNATEIEVGLLLNFGKKPQFKRKLFTNDKKIKSV